MTWFRVHNDILESSKLLMLAASDRWYFIALLSLKSQGELDKFKKDKLDRVIRAKLRLTQSEWEELSRRLQEEELIDSKYQPVGWDARQYRSDNSTERVRKHRAKKRRSGEGAEEANTVNGNGNETLHVTEGETLHGRSGNGIEAPPDTDTDTDYYSDPVGSAAGADDPPVDNSRLDRLSSYYDAQDQSPDGPPGNLFNLAVRVFGKQGVDEQRARSVIGKFLKEHGHRPTLDALAELVCHFPGSGNPVADMAVLLAGRKPMPKEWQPSEATLHKLRSVGIPENTLQDSRAFFRIWVQERDVTSADFDAWFMRWAMRDFEDAQLDVERLGAWYAGAAGSEFHEPPGSVPG